MHSTKRLLTMHLPDLYRTATALTDELNGSLAFIRHCSADHPLTVARDDLQLWQRDYRNIAQQDYRNLDALWLAGFCTIEAAICALERFNA